MKINIAILLSLFFIGINAKLSAQSGDRQLELLSNLSAYRTNVMTNSNADIDSLNWVIHKWQLIEPNEETFEKVLWDLLYSSELYDVSFKKLKNRTKVRHGESVLPQNVLENELKIVVANSELTSLIYYGLIQDNFPFSLKGTSSIFEELEYYDIKKGESIAEIGAGSGYFSLMMYLMGQNNQIYINEISDLLLKYIDHQIKKGNLPKTNSEIKLTKGSKKSTNLPEPVDKIIVINTFHHFKKMQMMLSSIKSNLKPDGVLYVKEAFKGKKDKSFCRSLMTEGEIKSELLRGGFAIVDEHEINDWVIFKLKAKQ